MDTQVLTARPQDGGEQTGAAAQRPPARDGNTADLAMHWRRRDRHPAARMPS
jgi:hypothetical protein